MIAAIFTEEMKNILSLIGVAVMTATSFLFAADATTEAIQNIVTLTASSSEQKAIVTKQVGLLEEERLMQTCGAGAMLGGLLSLCFFKVNGVKEMASKFLASAILGFICGSWTIEHFDLSRTTANILLITAAFGFTSWGLVHLLYHPAERIIVEFIMGWIYRLFGIQARELEGQRSSKKKSRF